MRKIIVLVAVAFALLGGTAVAVYPQQAVAKNILPIEPHLFLVCNDRPV